MTGSSVRNAILSAWRAMSRPGRQARARGEPANEAVPEAAVGVALVAVLRGQEMPTATCRLPRSPRPGPIHTADR